MPLSVVPNSYENYSLNIGHFIERTKIKLDNPRGVIDSHSKTMVIKEKFNNMLDLFQGMIRPDASLNPAMQAETKMMLDDTFVDLCRKENENGVAFNTSIPYHFEYALLPIATVVNNHSQHSPYSGDTNPASITLKKLSLVFEDWRLRHEDRCWKQIYRIIYDECSSELSSEIRQEQAPAIEKILTTIHKLCLNNFSKTQTQFKISAEIQKLIDYASSLKVNPAKW